MEELLELALDEPTEAGRRAELLLRGSQDPLALSYAHQALGIVLRDRGRMSDALRHLRRGVGCAQVSGREDREADVRATLAGTLVYAGRTRAGLAAFDRALAGASGGLAARILTRKAAVLAVVGRSAEAVPLMRSALREIAASGDSAWEARARIWLGYAELGRGQVARAEAEVRTAQRLLGAGLTINHLNVVENLAEIAVARGDLATGLRHYARSRELYAAAGREVTFPAAAAHAAAYLAAGMPSEAASLLDAFEADALAPVDRADLALLRATALRDAGQAGAAVENARRARSMFRRQGREWFENRSRLVALRADERPRSAEAATVADALHDQHADEAPLALTIAGRVTRGADRRARWEQAASYRTHPNALVRAAAWHARSLAREETGDRGGVLRAAAAGLDAIDEHRRLIGSSELRALATTHGRELTTIALRHAADDPRTLLRWSERTRATALAQPPATSAAATIPRSLAALRDNGRRLAEARQAGEPADALARERLRLERAVRAESHTLSASTAAQQRPPRVEEVVAAVGEGCLVELVDVDGVLHVLVVSRGTVRRRVAAATEEVAALLAPTQMLLRRASRGRATDMRGLGEQLQRAILGDAARLLPDGPVVLAPTARLHGLAWSLLPVLGERPFAVVPSAGAWLRARAAPRPRDRRTVLVSGPGLATGGAEVPLLAAAHPAASLLEGPAATLDAVLRSLDGADLVHLAAHGSFRADSPLFSALDLADGPLTVHDLERVRRAPYRVVLSACESGVLAPVGAEELLGLAAALFALGTAGLVSSVAEVNDTATADLMGALHDALASGCDPATALHAVRTHARDDPVTAGTAAAFLALGV